MLLTAIGLVWPQRNVQNVPLLNLNDERAGKWTTQRLGQNNPTRCSPANKPLIPFYPAQNNPVVCLQCPQTTQNFDPAQITQQCVYKNNPALFTVWGAPPQEGAREFQGRRGMRKNTPEEKWKTGSMFSTSGEHESGHRGQAEHGGSMTLII